MNLVKINNCKHCNEPPLVNFSHGQRIIFCWNHNNCTNDLEYIEATDCVLTESLKLQIIGFWNLLNPTIEDKL